MKDTKQTHPSQCRTKTEMLCQYHQETGSRDTAMNSHISTGTLESVSCFPQAAWLMAVHMCVKASDIALTKEGT